MNQHPSEAAQRGRTEFWENLRDAKLAEYGETLQGMRLWRPIDALTRRRQLRHIERFVTQATVIISESRDADQMIEQRQETRRPQAHFMTDITGYLGATLDKLPSYSDPEIA